MIKIKKIVVSTLLVFSLVAAMFVTWLYSQVDSALPQLNGNYTVMGLTKNVVIDRDKYGVPTIKAKTRKDLAIATGFIHAQERFFQMDLLRRNAAGELSSLFGNIALTYDKSIRLHRFRERAGHIVSTLPDDQKELLNAYTKGVNSGLRALKSSPFEYLLLRQQPVEWQAEDTVLSVLSMYLDLQYKEGDREQTLGILKSTLSDSAYSFLNPKGSMWDAAIDGSQYLPSKMPITPWPKAELNSEPIIATNHQPTDYNSEEFPGSNNWAVSGSISSTKSAIIANDMHLGIRVPNTWFRASFEYQTNDREKIKTTGLTLPGTPAMVAGSNGHIAWGFTNSYGDWSDVIILETNEDKSQYLTPDGFKAFTTHKQIIAVKNAEPSEYTSKETIWGPVIGKNHAGQLLAYRWVAHDIEAVNFFAKNLEQAKNIEQAFSIAAQSGIPAQNMMVGDKAGNIGWTIMGAIPQKTPNLGNVPVSWASGENQWLGYLTKEEYPKIKNPSDHRLWTANSRVIGGEMLDKVGNGGYALGARAKQIKADLFAKEVFTEKDLLNIALDDRALFLKRWQQFLLTQVLTTEAISDKPLWQQARKILKDNELRASINSVAYRLTRNFRINLRDHVFSRLNANMNTLDENYRFHTIRHQIETPLWQLINDQPSNFLWQPKEGWQASFNYALKKTLTDMTKDQPLSEATWGKQNTTNIRHPLTNGVPLLANWLNMPSKQLSGDSYMPKVQGKAFGASERMVVSPGHEESGILHMPTSQAGHPWSPYYGLGHEDWEQGKPSPFLPGKTQYSLTLLSY